MLGQSQHLQASFDDDPYALEQSQLGRIKTLVPVQIIESLASHRADVPGQPMRAVSNASHQPGKVLDPTCQRPSFCRKRKPLRHRMFGECTKPPQGRFDASKGSFFSTEATG